VHRQPSPLPLIPLPGARAAMATQGGAGTADTRAYENRTTELLQVAYRRRSRLRYPAMREPRARCYRSRWADSHFQNGKLAVPPAAPSLRCSRCQEAQVTCTEGRLLRQHRQHRLRPCSGVDGCRRGLHLLDRAALARPRVVIVIADDADGADGILWPRMDPDHPGSRSAFTTEGDIDA
jgi:hypothetical protein